MNVIAGYGPAGGGVGGPLPGRRWLRCQGLAARPVRVAALAAVSAVLLVPPTAAASVATVPAVAKAGPAARSSLTDRLLAVSCPARRRCIAVGIADSDHQAMLAERWNGRRWSVMTVPAPAGATSGGLTGVSCTSASACTVVGFDFIPATGSAPVAERWNGRRWHIQPAQAPGNSGVPFAAVSCGSTTSCTAVGYYDFGVIGFSALTLAEHWDGTSWAVQATPPIGDPGSDLTGVSCPSASVCTAAGYFLGQSDEGPGSAPLAMRWRAGTWTIQPTPGAANATGNVTSGLAGVSCPVASACTAVGESALGGPLALHWDGTSWRRQPISGQSTKPPLAGVSCPVATACTAVGGDFSPTHGLAEHWNGSSWSLQHLRLPTGANAIGMTAVSCSSRRRCTAVGFSSTTHGILTLAERWNGRRWAVQTTPSPAPA